VFPEVAVGETYRVIGSLQVDIGGQPVEKGKKPLSLCFERFFCLDVLSLRSFEFRDSLPEKGRFVLKLFYSAFQMLHSFSLDPQQRKYQVL
jgi:hypothetical protein